MRKYDQLSEAERKLAVDHCLEEIFISMVEDDMIPDCMDEYIDIINAAMAEAERLHTPWFFLDILQAEIGKNAEMEATILSEADRVAKLSWYPDPNEIVIYLSQSDNDKKDLNLN